MGLAPYGKPKYSKIIKDNLIEIKDDGSFRLNMKYFDYCTNLKMTNKNFENSYYLDDGTAALKKNLLYEPNNKINKLSFLKL